MNKENFIFLYNARTTVAMPFFIFHLKFTDYLTVKLSTIFNNNMIFNFAQNKFRIEENALILHKIILN